MAFADPGISRQIINSGVGPEAPTVTLAAACKRGDVLGYNSGWVLADADGVVQGRLIALADGAIGDVIPVSPRAVVGGYTGATAGSPVYVSTTGGVVTQTIPTTATYATTVIGIALSATEVLFILNSRADSVVAS